MKNRKNPFLDFNKKLKGVFSNFGSDADKDWIVICSLFVILFFITVIWSVYLYFSMSREVSSNEINDVSSLSLINKKGLQNLIDNYNQKKIDFDGFRNTKPDVVDPSL